MIKVDFSVVLERLNPFCHHALEEAASLSVSQRALEVGVGHFFCTILDNPFSDVYLILKHFDIDVDMLKQCFSKEFATAAAENIETIPAFSPLLIELFQEAWMLGSLEMSQKTLRSGTLFLVALLNASRYFSLDTVKLMDAINRESLRKQFSSLLADSGENDKSAVSSPQNVGSQVATALEKYGYDLTEKARQQEIDPVLSRDDEIDLMIDILLRRRKNNPIAVGEAGVGKSAVVEGLALRIVAKKVPDALKNVALWVLDLGALQSGASVKGEFEKRLKSVIDQVKYADTPIILFIDEAHTLIGAGGQAGGSDAANLLKPALARGELRTIAATTWSEYKKYFEKDPALSRRFQLVKLEEPTVEQATTILRGLREVYETDHGVYIQDEALEAAAAMSARYISGRQLPDKAIDILDTACARVASGLQAPPKYLSRLEGRRQTIAIEREQLQRDARAGAEIDPEREATLAARQEALVAEYDALYKLWQQQKQLVEAIVDERQCQLETTAETPNPERLLQYQKELRQLQASHKLLQAEVNKTQVAAVISDLTGIPVSTMTGSELERVTHLPDTLNSLIKGQSEGIDFIYRHLLASLADLQRPGIPMGAFLLVGPSGVGKTETALQIAKYLFGSQQFMTTVNMSEYQEKHSLSRLIGSPPGYIGYGEGGVLSEAIRQKPYSVVLLDEVEKAHPEVLNLFYQAFDKGEIADGEGRIIDCKNILFFLTSNIGFDSQDASFSQLTQEQLRTSLLQFFKPALLARMQVVQYHYLSAEVMAQIVQARLQQLIERFQSRHGGLLQIDEQVVDKLKQNCHYHANGARMLDAAINGELLPPLSLLVLQSLAKEVSLEKAYLFLADDGSIKASLSEPGV